MTYWSQLLNRRYMVAGSNLFECPCMIKEIPVVGHFVIMLQYQRGNRSSYIYDSNELCMLIILKHGKTSWVFFSMSNKQMPGVNFDIKINFHPYTFFFRISI